MVQSRALREETFRIVGRIEEVGRQDSGWAPNDALFFLFGNPKSTVKAAIEFRFRFRIFGFPSAFGFRVFRLDRLLGGQSGFNRLSGLGRIRHDVRFESLQDLSIPANKELAEIPFDIAWIGRIFAG